jgi:hypothetical protein
VHIDPQKLEAAGIDHYRAKAAFVRLFGGVSRPSVRCFASSAFCRYGVARS